MATSKNEKSVTIKIDLKEPCYVPSKGDIYHVHNLLKSFKKVIFIEEQNKNNLKEI